jgi:hypothetical protein
METISRTKAIMEYFSKNSRKVTLAELKELSEEDRKELGELAAKELGKEIA